MYVCICMYECVYVNTYEMNDNIPSILIVFDITCTTLGCIRQTRLVHMGM